MILHFSKRLFNNITHFSKRVLFDLLHFFKRPIPTQRYCLWLCIFCILSDLNTCIHTKHPQYNSCYTCNDDFDFPSYKFHILPLLLFTNTYCGCLYSLYTMHHTAAHHVQSHESVLIYCRNISYEYIPNPLDPLDKAAII